MTTKATKKTAATRQAKDIQKILASAVWEITESDAQWQKNPFEDDGFPREPGQPSEDESKIVALLTLDLSEASAQLTKQMRKKEDWWTGMDSIFQSTRNFDYFDPYAEEWLECAKTAISLRFLQLLALRRQKAGRGSRTAVHESADTILRIVQKQCWLNDAFRSMSFLDCLPGGVPDRQASYEPVGSYLRQRMETVCTHVERLREEAVVKAALEPQPDVALAQWPPLEDEALIAPAGVPDSPTRIESQANRFVKDKDVWHISYGRENVTVPDRIGFGYIALLLRTPNQPVQAKRLLGLSKSEDALLNLVEDGYDTAEINDQFDLQHECLDDRARQEYKAEAARIASEIKDARDRCDDKKVNDLMNDLQAIEDQMSANTALGGKSRRFAGDSEKARISVTNAISRAIDKLAPHAPNTAAHLKSKIETGTSMTYRDDRTMWAL